MTVDTATVRGTSRASIREGVSRRDVMRGACASAFALGTTPAWANAPVLASGTVFHDRSGTGTRQRGDPGIGGVLVSNGRDVVRTDADGHWQLALREGDSAFVIKPPHWSTPLGRSGVPNFSYLHQPSGTPPALALRFPGVDPTGPLPATIDFPLRPSPEPDRFEALMLADPQPQDARELSFLRDDLAATVMQSPAAFALVHGDVAFDDLSLYPRYLDLIGATSLPWHHCPGNHDMNNEATETRFAFETWKRTFGPCHYAFQHARATFILLNNVSRTPGGQRTYGAAISREQLAFVRNLLAYVPRDQLVVVSMHIPLKSTQNVADPVPNVEGRETLLRLLSGHHHTVSFSGHTHTAEHHYLGAGDGFAGPIPHHHNVLTAASGSWWGGPVDHRGIPFADCQDGTPRGLHVLEVDGNTYRTRLAAAATPAATALVRITIEAGGRLQQAPIPRRELASCRILANIFDGGPKTVATYEIAGHGRGAAVMQREQVTDPGFSAMFAGSPGAFKPWVRPVVSSHIWSAPLPTNLQPGAHRLTLRAVDEYGRARTSLHLVEIDAGGEASAAIHAAVRS